MGAKREEVVLEPSAGFDGAVINVGNKSLIVSMDPITGAMERIGWLAVNINANDIATFGVQPSLFASCILLPENGDKKTLETICVQMDKAAKDLGIAIIGGHCEVTPSLINPIVIGCAMGMAEKGKYVTAGDAKPGDKLVLTKSVGIEGTAILATEKTKQLKKALDSAILQSAKKFYNKISVVKDALIAVKTGGVHAMHDPTEGGVSGGIHEMAEASNVGFQIYEEKIPIQPETRKICEYFKIDPLQLISSGALLISAKPELAEKIVEKLKHNKINASVIGDFLENKREHRIIRKDGTIQTLPRPVSDHLWLALKI
ncbi:MAG: AIR synthase family protein [Candidatus Bathyarchaeota archaeon]|nr:AIR synthase family protein [Candidatus Bathyarchaeota archaeon]